VGLVATSSQSIELQNPLVTTFRPSLPITITARVRTVSTGLSQGVLSTDNFNFGSGKYYGVMFLINTSNQLTAHYGDGGSPGSSSRRSFAQNSGDTVSVDAWHSVAVVITGPTEGSLWIDGESQPLTTTGSGGALKYSANSGGIGRASLGQFLDGAINNVTVHNRALTPAEIQQLHADPHARHRRRRVVVPAVVAAPTGALMNQIQGTNLGADLYNGTLL
jgi:hypothetical protein